MDYLYISAISNDTDESGRVASFTLRLASEPTDNITLSISSSDTTEGYIKPIGSSKVTTFAGNGSNASTDGTGLSSSFSYPQGIASDGSYLYVSGGGSHKIRKVIYQDWLI